MSKESEPKTGTSYPSAHMKRNVARYVLSELEMILTSFFINFLTLDFIKVLCSYIREGSQEISSVEALIIDSSIINMR